MNFDIIKEKLLVFICSTESLIESHEKLLLEITNRNEFETFCSKIKEQFFKDVIEIYHSEPNPEMDGHYQSLKKQLKEANSRLKFYNKALEELESVNKLSVVFIK